MDKSAVRISMKPMLGNANKFSVTFENLYDDLKVGNAIRLDDGKLELIVIEKDETNRELG